MQTKIQLTALFFVLLVFPVPVGVQAELVGYWDFEMSAGDVSGNQVHGQLVGDTVFDTDVPSGIRSTHSILLDGDGDWVALGNPDALNFGSNDWTLVGWLSTTRTGLGDENEGTVFGNGGDWTGGIRYTLVLSEGNIEGVPTLVIDDNRSPPGSSFNKQVLVASTAVNDGDWHHVAGVRAEDEMRIYVDGILEGTRGFNPAYDLTGINQHPAYIGAITDNRDGQVFKNFDGRLDDIALWDEALTSEMIQALADGRLTPLSVPEPPSITIAWFGLLAALSWFRKRLARIIQPLGRGARREDFRHQLEARLRVLHEPGRRAEARVLQQIRPLDRLAEGRPLAVRHRGGDHVSVACLVDHLAPVRGLHVGHVVSDEGVVGHALGPHERGPCHKC